LAAEKSEEAIMKNSAVKKTYLLPSESSEFYNLRMDEGLSVQQTAELTGLSEHTLRYYERIGLIKPVRRQASSKHRRYSMEDVAKIESLACLRAVGMPLDLMRRYFEMAPEGAKAAPELQALLEEQRQVLQERMRQMQKNLDYLEHKITYWRAIEAGDQKRADEIGTEVQKLIKSDARRSDSAAFVDK
jgi:MerR family transcriptional regulator, aldehyde-responsive regulator